MGDFVLPAGILAAMLHVISGPDHLAAVSPLVIESKRKAWKIGIAWGVGHTTGMLLIGVLMLLFKELIPVDAISAYSEQIVGIILIGVGLWAFYRIFHDQREHNHPHIHVNGQPYIHIHKHRHNHESHHQHHHDEPVKQNIFSSFGIGLIHGLAGIAHFLLLLPALALPTKMAVGQYIAGFAIGSVLAMGAYALVLGRIVTYTREEHHPLFLNGIRLAGGLFAVVIGSYWIYLNM